ncbi:hypothetical protein Tco_1242803 [Tanacetum coccineum]
MTGKKTTTPTVNVDEDDEVVAASQILQPSSELMYEDAENALCRGCDMNVIDVSLAEVVLWDTSRVLIHF